MNFAQQLKILRGGTGMTQADLAYELGLSRATIAGYENSGKQPTFEILVKIATYFGVTTDYMLGVQKNTAAQKKKDLMAAIDDALKDYDVSIPQKGRSPKRSFASIFPVIMMNAEKAGIEDDVIKLLVECNLAIDDMVSTARDCYTWMPEEFSEYELDSDYHYNIRAASFTKTPELRDLLEQYPPEMVHRIRATDFRNSTQRCISDLTGAIDKFTNTTYENLREGKPPRRKGDTNGDGAKEGK